MESTAICLTLPTPSPSPTDWRKPLLTFGFSFFQVTTIILNNMARSQFLDLPVIENIKSFLFSLRKEEFSLQFHSSLPLLSFVSYAGTFTSSISCLYTFKHTLLYVILHVPPSLHSISCFIPKSNEESCTPTLAFPPPAANWNSAPEASPSPCQLLHGHAFL